MGGAIKSGWFLMESGDLVVIIRGRALQSPTGIIELRLQQGATV